MASPHRSTRAQRRVGRPSGPTEHGAASRERILDAAATVFAQLGYDRARMADVVETSGMTKGSVYFHFENKEALAVAVLTEKHAQWLDRVQARLTIEPAGNARLEALLPAMLELHRDDPDAWVISRLTQNLAEVPATRALATELTRRWIDTVADLIRDSRRHGGVSVGVDPDLLATVVVGAFDGLKTTIETISEDPRTAASQLEAGGTLLLTMMRSVVLPADHQ
ncbi:TetR/AcrR family transcriptional regulator [Nocardia arizonensis]|uniref:TetR/AcrR family transcriptional regulator n=1 Tax=Nocardia arizonensis TaxID=1141647 RepID=UPI0009ECB23E|nr:TetR/AcrR family transcriptional regulator [Nocardia arizonensis]